MASDRRSSFSSAFDDMLESNWRELDSMYTSPSGGTERTTYRRDEAGAPSFPESDFTGARKSTSPVIDQLNERLGSQWRYDIAERHRDGDEVVVLCKLTLPDQSVTKAQFGLARIGRGGSGSAVRGSSGGVSFSLGTSETAALSGDTEDAAYQRAIDDALSKCAAML